LYQDKLNLYSCNIDASTSMWDKVAKVRTTMEKNSRL